MKLTFPQYPISEEIESQCMFFKSPTQTANGIAGKLMYEHLGGIWVNLMHPIEFEENMTLYARGDNHNCYTLYNVRRRMSEEMKNSRYNKLLDADYLIVASEFPSSNSFKSISFDLTNLYEWFPKFKHISKNYKRKKQVAFPITPSVSVNTPSNTSISFHSEILEKWKPHGVEFELDCKIVIKPTSAVNFNELFQNVQKYRTLFQLMSGDYSAITEIFVHDNRRKYRTYFIDGKSDYNLKWGAGGGTFLKLSSIEKSLPEIIRNWDGLYDKIGQVIDILIMEYNNYSLNPEVRFLNVARAIETFHNKLRIAKKTDKKLSDLVMDVKKRIPKKYKDKFDECLGFITRQNLNGRITELYNEIKKDTKKELNFQDDWIIKFVKSRNHYTHFGDMNKNVLVGIPLQELSNRVRTFLYILVAKELGIKEKILAKEVHNLILI